MHATYHEIALLLLISAGVGLLVGRELGVGVGPPSA